MGQLWRAKYQTEAKQHRNRAETRGSHFETAKASLKNNKTFSNAPFLTVENPTLSQTDLEAYLTSVGLEIKGQRPDPSNHVFYDKCGEETALQELDELPPILANCEYYECKTKGTLYSAPQTIQRRVLTPRWARKGKSTATHKVGEQVRKMRKRKEAAIVRRSIQPKACSRPNTAASQATHKSRGATHVTKRKPKRDTWR